MKLYYDLHIHSCLSPCGDDDMTPNNIVNMAALKGLDVIAVSDHNSCLNSRAAIAVGRQAGVLVLPALELTTSEDFHVLCLFEELEGAEEFGLYISSVMPKIENNIKIFGNQFIMDENDDIIGSESRLLIYSGGISSSGLGALLEKYGGIAVPAHVNKDSCSMLSVLGFIDPAEGYPALEISKSCDIESFARERPDIIPYNLLRNSDAHYLGDISERENFLESEEKSPAAFLNAVKKRIF